MPPPSDRRALLLGLAASSLFSATFIVNRAIGLAHGDWVWTATLRYAWVLILFVIWFGARQMLGDVVTAFRRHWVFWIIAGSIREGVWYCGLVYASTRAPAWIVACTLQSTILATPIVLRAFGSRVQRHGIALLVLIFIGIVFVNLDRRGAGGAAEIFRVWPVVVAAFATPIGFQLLQVGRNGGRGLIPHLREPVTGDAAARTFLLAIGSIPLWLVVLLVPHTLVPTTQQVLGTAVVALAGTVVGTSLFLKARQSVGADPNRIARIDATQSAYTVFSLAGEVALLGGAWPGPLGFTGLLLMLAGLVAYSMVGKARTR